MPNPSPNHLLYWNLVLLTGFATASSGLLAAPGFKAPAFFGSMVMLAFGPMAEHLFETTSIARWILDAAFSLAILGMIVLRNRRASSSLSCIAFVAVLLWYSSAFITLLNHGE